MDERKFVPARDPFLEGSAASILMDSITVFGTYPLMQDIFLLPVSIDRQAGSVTLFVPIRFKIVRKSPLTPRSVGADPRVRPECRADTRGSAPTDWGQGGL